eukprot:Nitzschia sp. Nitz4//scaffold2_size372955//236488//239256//NITZ4_000444-RA/size372955-processed-gene-0.436-mRNA-1//1//CDS//3329546841//2964//frame0
MRSYANAALQGGNSSSRPNPAATSTSTSTAAARSRPPASKGATPQPVTLLKREQPEQSASPASQGQQHDGFQTVPTKKQKGKQPVPGHPAAKTPASKKKNTKQPPKASHGTKHPPKGQPNTAQKNKKPRSDPAKQQQHQQKAQTKQPTPSLVPPPVMDSSAFPALAAPGPSLPKNKLAFKPNLGKQSNPKSSNTPSTVTTNIPSSQSHPASSKTKNANQTAKASHQKLQGKQPTGKKDSEEQSEAHKLIRLLQVKKIYEKRGKQRVNARKKKLSTLKKKVLYERLRQWQSLHPPALPPTASTTNPTASSNPTPSSVVCVYNFLQEDMDENDEEYEELVDNLQSMASKIGAIGGVFLPRSLDRPSNKYPAFVRFEQAIDASAAQACWDGLVLGGDALVAKLVPLPSLADGEDWKSVVVEAEEQATTGTSNESTNVAAVNTKLIVQNVLTQEDFEDEECMEETMDDLRVLASKWGDLVEICIPENDPSSVSLVYRGMEPAQVERAVFQLSSTTLGGQQLVVVLDNAVVPSTDTTGSDVVLLPNILNDDDIQDQECLAETLEDIRDMAGDHPNSIQDICVVGKTVKITYHSSQTAQAAASAMNGRVLGGVTLVAHLETPTSAQVDPHQYLYLQNLLSEEDMEDDDCLQESLDDIRTLAAQHGTVCEVHVLPLEDSSGDVNAMVVAISYDSESPEILQTALAAFHGMIVGGSVVEASLHRPGTSPPIPDDPGAITMSDDVGGTQNTSSIPTAQASPSDPKDAPTPLYSGDKLIPERFAEAKRVPKVPNTGVPRAYAESALVEGAKPLLSEMLGELMRLQKRAVQEGNTKVKRRLVMGMREVARGIRAHKVKMVIMANNLDEYDAIDGKLQGILDLAKNESVPVFFDFSKRTLGKALGKTIKIAVVGVQNAEGAHPQFKKLTNMAKL